MKKYPIPFTLIEKMDRHELVKRLLKHLPAETDQFLYGMNYNTFLHFFKYYYTDCDDTIELADEVYVHIIKEEPPKKSKLASFKFRCKIEYWMWLVTQNFCHTQWRKHRELTYFDSNEDSYIHDDRIIDVTIEIDRDDFEKMIDMIPSERYRKLIQYKDLEGLDYDEIAEIMGDKKTNCYKAYYQALQQFKKIVFKEMEIE